MPNNPLYEFIGLLAFSTLWSLQRKAVATNNSFIITIAMCWGAALHELTHYIVALVTGAKPSFPSIVASRANDDESETTAAWTIGSVQCYVYPISRAFIGLAPLLLLPLAAIVALYWHTWFEAPIATTVAKYLLLQLLISNSTPSSSDLRMAFGGNTAGGVIAIVIAVAIATAIALLL
jgi:hypothetical protein